jgi:hypothetical protein
MEGTTPFCDLSVNSRQEHTSTPIDTPFSPPLQMRFASGLEEALEVRLADVNVRTLAGAIVSSIRTPSWRPVGPVSAPVAVLLG